MFVIRNRITGRTASEARLITLDASVTLEKAKYYVDYLNTNYAHMEHISSIGCPFSVKYAKPIWVLEGEK